MEFKTDTKGSLTIFMSLTIVMVMSLLFALVEVVHFTGLNKITDSVSLIGTESAFADFNRILLEEYGVLGMDAGYCEENLNIGKVEARVGTYLFENLRAKVSELAAVSFYRANSSVEILDYGVLTDSGGAAFIKEAAKEIVYGMPDDLLNELRNQAASFGDISLSEDSIEDVLNNSSSQISQAVSGERDSTEDEEIPESSLSDSDMMLLKQNGNPIEAALAWKSNAVLSQVIADVSSISNRTLPGADIPSKRLGNFETAGQLSVSTTERALFGQYLKTKFGSYRNNLNHEGLSYEWEYVINGKDSDLKNLEATVVKLLGLREAQNLIAIMADPVKQETALGIATAICAAIAMPALIGVVKLGVIAAWAYLESVLDVRLLLMGGRVAFVKTDSQWTSNILLFPTYLNPSITARDCDGGMSYEDYLFAMSVIMSAKQLGVRSLDVVEMTIRSQENYENVRMENFLYRARFLYTYEAEPVFASVMPLLAGKVGPYTITVTKEISYI